MYPDQVLTSRDGLRAFLLTRAEGPASVGDAMAVAFTTLLPAKDRGPRAVVQLSGTVYETYEPEQLGIPSSDNKIHDWYSVGEATLGDWIDDLPMGTDLAALPSPLVIKCTSYTVESWKKRSRADENDVLSFAANKLYWAWRFELDGARFTAADCLRLRTSLATIERILLLEEGTLWQQSDSSDHSLLYAPTPTLLKAQRERRIHGQAGTAKTGLEAALAAPRYSGVRTHLSKSQSFLEQDPPDLANSAKEAICAVEALARLVCNDHNATLGDLIKQLKTKQDLDPALLKALEGIWGYTSNAPGVRHGGTADLDVAQAQITLDLARSSIYYLLRADTA